MAYVGKTPANAVLTSSDITDGVITSAKIATDAVIAAKIAANAVEEAKVNADAITSAKIAAGAIVDSDVNASAAIGITKLASSSITINGSAVSLGGSVTIGETKPTVTAVSAIIPPSVATSVTITGTNFASDSTHVPIVEAVSSTNAYTRASVVSWASATSISATFDLPLGDYRVRVENPDGNAGMSANAILQSSTAPTWTTAAGSLGTVAALGSVSFTVVATSDSAVTYAKTSGTFPGGVTIASATGIISGTETGSSATTTYTFEITPTDAEAQAGAAREFTMTISHGATGGGQFN